MPQRSKGARIYLRPERAGRHGAIRPAVWIIRDGGHTESTGCRALDRDRAQEALRQYLNRKHTDAAAIGSRRPDQIAVADVLNLYAQNVIPKVSVPIEALRRVDVLLAHFGQMKLSEINGTACRSYVSKRRYAPAARRELEDLRAAINYHRREGLCSEIVSVALPEKSAPRERFLTRDEAAAAIWAAWRYREKQNLRGTDRRTRRHIARMILVGIYTGTRPGTILAAALQPETGRPWFDLARGVFYRRPAGKRETKKRQPPAPIPERLLAHLRRWKRLGQRYVVEWNGAPVQRVKTSFAAVMTEAGLEDVTPHVLRHTAVTWAMIGGAELYQAARFFGLTPETLDRVYGHHHPEHLAAMKQVMNAGGRATGAHQLQRNEARLGANVEAGKARKQANA